MLCTSPCFPKCTEEATHELLTFKNSSHLGFNCDKHLAPLNFTSTIKNGKEAEPDYKKKLLKTS